MKVDVSWHSSDGVELFIDEVLVDTDTQPATNEIDFNVTWRVFIGRANSDMRHENFANAIFDDVEFWETRRSGIDSLAYNNGSLLINFLSGNSDQKQNLCENIPKLMGVEILRFSGSRYKWSKFENPD